MDSTPTPNASVPVATSGESQPPSSWLRFSLKTLLIMTLVIAAFFAGWMGDRWMRRSHPIAGDYTVHFSGNSRAASIVHLTDDNYQIGGCGVLNGVYQLKEDRLVVVRPIDKRMVGLIWSRSGRGNSSVDGVWTLINEPLGTPTGSSYVGVTLVPIKAGDP